MDCFFLSDGGPDAEDYASNYYYFNSSDTDTFARIKQMLDTCDTQDPRVRTELHRLCNVSLQHKSAGSKPVGLTTWLKRISSKCRQFALTLRFGSLVLK